MDDKLSLRIDSVLEHIGKILRDTTNISLEQFKESDLLVRATCFSIAQIGEQMAKLESILGSKYPDIPWKYARGMRNFLVHDYDNVDYEQVYSVIKNDLPQLEISFLKIKKTEI